MEEASLGGDLRQKREEMEQPSAGRLRVSSIFQEQVGSQKRVEQETPGQVTEVTSQRMPLEVFLIAHASL